MTSSEQDQDMSGRATDAAAEPFRRMFEEEYDYVYHSLRRLGVHSRDLEDVVHEVFVQVWKNFARIDPTRPRRPWLFAFAFRFASTYRRLSRHRLDLGADADPAASEPGAEEVMQKKDAARLLEGALAEMSVEVRAVFVLYEIDETPMKDIADALEIPANTAYSRLRLARASFERYVKASRERDAEKGGAP